MPEGHSSDQIFIARYIHVHWIYLKIWPGTHGIVGFGCVAATSTVFKIMI